jgi:hypothetical protein
MTRVDLKGQRPDDATETRGLAEQGRREEVDADVEMKFSNRTFLILLAVIVVVFGGIAIAMRL